MPQVLYVKSKDEQTTTAVKVLRSWAEASGRVIFLHANGVYGDKSGAPVRDLADLQILPPAHRKHAEAWWERAGRKLSEEYYARIAAREAARAGDYQQELAQADANTALDSILYARRPIVKGKPATAVTAPQAWMEFGFAARPDWWGQAKTIAFADFEYIMHEDITDVSGAGKAEK